MDDGRHSSVYPFNRDIWRLMFELPAVLSEAGLFLGAVVVIVLLLMIL
jgi:hypothetical protein